MTWEPDLSLPIDEYQIDSLDFISASAKESRFNLVPYFTNLELVESLDSPFLTGSLEFSVLKGELVAQGVNFTMQDFLLVGVSSVESIQTLGDKTSISEPRMIGGLFYITDMIKKEITDPKVDTYKVSFASTEVLNEFTKKISKSYKNKTRSEIVKLITEDFLLKDSVQNTNQIGTFEDTKDSFQCVIPRWSPIKAISWLRGGSVSAENQDSKCFYFFQTFDEDLNRKLNYTSFRTMLRKNPTIGFKDNLKSGYAIMPYDVNTDEFSKRALSRRVPLRCVVRGVSGLEQISKGTFSSKLLSHDVVRKKFTEHTFEYDNETVANEKINVGLMIEDNKAQENFDTLFLKSGESFVKMNSDHKNLFRKSETNLGVNKTETWFQDKLSQSNTKDYIKMDITLYGDTSRNVGETVMFTTYGAYEKDDAALVIDEMGQDLGGKYLITKLVHKFNISDEDGSNPARNTTTMTLVKDGLQS
tara:strand:- start:2686 stop:4104 length:1419 start_codon:yes stop_codon:yes gene_type:complete